MEQGRGRKLLMLMALGFSCGTMYLYPYIRYVFYDWQLEAMGLSNAQLGLLVSVYGIFATILYIPEVSWQTDSRRRRSSSWP